MIAISSMAGCWSDYYMCKKGRELETINYMLALHKEDFPITACVGFTIKESEEFVKIYPKVIRQGGKIHDYFQGQDEEVNLATS